jgi:hypothetical protein
MVYRTRRGLIFIIWIFGATWLIAACGSTSTESVTGPSAPKCSVSLTGPAESIHPNGGGGAIVVTTQPECAWTATAEASWLTDLTPSQGQGDGQVQFQVSANPNANARSGAININGQRSVIQQGGSACEFDLRINLSQFPAAGGSGVVTVAGPAGCAWTASSNVGWIVVATPAGSGSADVSFTVAANTGAARTGVVTIGGHPVTIQQSAANVQTCTVAINPTSQSVPSAGATGVAVTVTAASGCARPATSNATWITVVTGATGSGNGTVTLNVAANNGAARTGTVTIGGQVFTVNQAAAQTCTVTINPTSQTVPATGATGISVAVTAPSECARPATSNATWITVASGATGSGAGTVTLNVAANSGAARTGTVTIGGQIFTVNQAAAQTCTVAINPTSQSVPAAGATGVIVTVTAPSGCARPATSNATWITVASGATGSGNGTVTLNVAANAGAARTGTVTIGDQTFTVNQAAAAAQCSYSINPTSQTVGSDAGTGSPVAVTAAAGCAWTATANVGWLQITSGASGTGNGTVNFNFSSFSGSSRTGTLTIAGQTFTVSQVRCTITVAPTLQAAPALGGTFSATVTTQTGCRWTADSHTSWITVTAGADGVGNGTFSYSVGVNLGGARSGHIDIEDARLDVNQAAVLK